MANNHTLKLLNIFYASTVSFQNQNTYSKILQTCPEFDTQVNLNEQLAQLITHYIFG